MWVKSKASNGWKGVNVREINKHPILHFERQGKIHFIFEGRSIEAYQNETVAMALYRNGLNVFSESVKLHRPRGMFCAIGKCSSCMMRVNGIPNVRTCILPVREGMVVERQKGMGEKPDKVVQFPKAKEIREDITIIGGGPAGLSAALTLKKYGITPLVVEQNPQLGGQLIKQTHKFFGSKEENAGTRGIKIASKMVHSVKEQNIKYFTNSSAFGLYPPNTLAVFKNNQFIKVKSNYFIFATGAAEKMLPFPGNDIPGVFGAGAAQTLMNVFGIRPGRSVLMVGAGNVGLIVSYQLLQAGVEVKAVVEAMPQIGGYFVHSAKLRRFGVPILTSATIKEVKGINRVEQAVTVSLDKNFKEIPGTEKVWDVDTVCLSTGLIPSVTLLAQAGCDIKYVPSLGGYVPLRKSTLETSLKNVFVAGDITGIEEASTAMLEGIVAAYSILNKKGKDVKKEQRHAMEELKKLRSGPFGKRIREGLKEVEYE